MLSEYYKFRMVQESDIICIWETVGKRIELFLHEKWHFYDNDIL